MKALFRADGNTDLGLGHIMRCLTLAYELKNSRVSSDILFITKHEEGLRIIEEKGYKVVRKDADEILQIRSQVGIGALLVTDFLDTDSVYISQIKENTDINVIAMDNNTRLKRIDADIVINANVFDEGETKVIGSTTYYLGPKYVILRREFEKARQERKQKPGEVRNILVMSGGADFAGGRLTFDSIRALERIDDDIRISVVIGPAFSYRRELSELLEITKRRFDVLFDPPNLIEIMKSAELAVTAAGLTLYELAALGVPSVVVPQVTPNTRHQEDIANAFEAHGACVNLGRFPSSEVLYDKTIMIIKDKALRKRLSDKGRALVDGFGLERGLNIILDCASH